MANLNIAVQIAAKDQGASGVIGGITKGLSSLGSIAGGAVSVALGGVLTGAIGTVTGKIGEFWQGALDAQVGLTALGGQIDRLGARAPITQSAALSLADQLKNLAGGSDDAVIAAENMLLRFNKIGKETFPDVLRSSLDLAATLKVGPEQAAQMLGKTLQDLSTDGTGALGRLKAAGVALTDQQEQQIKKMVETGDVAGAQRVLLEALAETTGGKAAEAAGTAAGQWAIFQEQIADAGEGVFQALLPSLTQLTSTVLPALLPIIAAVGAGAAQWITNTLVPAFQMAVAWFQANWPAIQQTALESWAQMQPALQAIGDFLTGVVVPAIAAVIAWVVANWPQIQATIQSVMVAIQQVIQSVLAAIQTFWATWGDEIMAVINFFVDQARTIFAAFSAAFQGDWTTFGELLRVAWDSAWKAITTIVQTAIDWFRTQDWGKIGADILKAIATGLANAGQWLIDAARTAAKAAFDAAMGFFGGGGGGGGGTEGRAGGGPVYSGWPYWVGEQGAEPFFPAIDGRILSRPDAMAALSGAGAGGAGAPVSIYVDARGATNPRAIEDAGYRGARRALAEVGRRADARGRGRR